MGRTGSGKTTLAEILCGLREPFFGRVYLGGRNVTDLPAGERGIGYVPQDAALFPTLNVEANLGFALRVRRVPVASIATTVRELAERLGIGHLLHRSPHELSGGEKQRVALGRALAGRPAALVLDEPLSAVDYETREGLVKLLKDMQKSLAVTVLHITHHPHEAAQLADKLFRLENGVIVET